VIFAVLIFSIIIIVVTGMMNRGLTTVQAAAERTAAADERNAQAEALRFIHSGWTAERQNNPATWQFQQLWQALKARAVDWTVIGGIDATNCNPAATPAGAFVINTRNLRLAPATNLVGGNGDATIVTFAAGSTIFQTPQLYPRIIYKQTLSAGAAGSEDVIQEGVAFDRIWRVEGVWVLGVRSRTTAPGRPNEPEYYDFHIRTCWLPPGTSVVDNAVSIVRLYNPEAVE
jgi:hypothetical protein